MKAAPVVAEFKNYRAIHPILIHTGQHYDTNLSKIFFDDLKLPQPHFYLGIGSGSHSEQSAKIMLKFENLLSTHNPHLVVVVGDVNSTLACALAAAKYRTTKNVYRPYIAHVEAGLRSFDWHMPEEINRRLTDALSDLLFTTEPVAEINLIKEGIDNHKIFFIGNVMIDTLLRFKRIAEQSTVVRKLKLQKRDYAVLTMHRPTNVDELKNLREILRGLKEVSESIPIVFPIHPRTKKMFKKYRLTSDFLKIIPPLGYIDFLKLMMEAQLVFTDSGGIQEETAVLNIPCLTLRENTERPITVSQGTNIVVGTRASRIMMEARIILNGEKKQGRIPKFWDGKAAKRISKIIYNFLRTHC